MYYPRTEFKTIKNYEKMDYGDCLPYDNGSKC